MNLKIKESHRDLFHEELYICYEFYQENDVLCGDGYIYFGTKHIRQFGNLGYHIYEEHRRKGYASEACRMMIDLLKERGWKEVCILVDETNVYSNRICERLGGHIAAKIKQDDPLHAYKNLYIVSI